MSRIRALVRERLQGVSLQQLGTFCRMFQERSFAATARALDLAVPTAWEQIKALERSYGTPLFQRRGRQMEPTRAAQALFEIAEPLLVRIESSFDEISAGTSRAPTSITIVGGMRMLVEDFGEALRRLRALHGATRLRLIAADERSAQEQVHAGDADVGFLLEPPPGERRDGLVYERSHEIDYLAVFPRRHRLAGATRVSLSSLVEEPLVVGHPDTVGRRLLEQALHREGLLDRLEIAAETNNSATTLACVHSRIGVGIVGGHAHGPLMRQLAMVSLGRQLGTARIVSVVREGRVLPGPVEDLRRLLIETARERSSTRRARKGTGTRARPADAPPTARKRSGRRPG